MFWSPRHRHRRDVQIRPVSRLATLFGLFPFLGKLFADSAYQGPVFHRALAGILPDLETEIVKRSDRVKGFVVQPRRWVVERTIAWLNRCRRLTRTSTPLAFMARDGIEDPAAPLEELPGHAVDKLRYPRRCGRASTIPPGKPGGVYPRGDQRREVHSVAPAASGERCPRICRPEAPCMITSACGTASIALPQVPRESRARSQTPASSTVRV